MYEPPYFFIPCVYISGIYRVSTSCVASESSILWYTIYNLRHRLASSMIVDRGMFYYKAVMYKAYYYLKATIYPYNNDY